MSLEVIFDDLWFVCSKNRGVAMLKKICSLILSFFIVVILSGCGRQSDKRVNIVTSFYPMYIIAMNLADGIEDVSITNMAENHTGCLHDFQIQSDDMKKIEKANAFIINGAGMETFLDKVKDTYPNMPIIDSSTGIDIIDDEHEHGHSGHDDHYDEASDEHGNPHIWVSISNYIRQVENICDGLILVDTDNREKYIENKEKYLERLGKLKERMHDKLDSLPNKDIITFHEAFPYFAKEFGLNIVALINREPESEPSVKEISDTIETVKNSKVKALFVEPQYPDTSAKTIAKETGAKIYTLDPASSGEISKDAYINAMEKNMEVLESALS